MRDSLARFLDWVPGGDGADVPIILWVLLGFLAVVILWAVAQVPGKDAAESLRAALLARY
jgi:hypothetical protein